jgi:dual-specificity kinase
MISIKKPEFFGPRGVDYPNPSTSKSSRKFVKNLKNLKDIVIQNSPHNKQLSVIIFQCR